MFLLFLLAFTFINNNSIIEKEWSFKSTENIYTDYDEEAIYRLYEEMSIKSKSNNFHIKSNKKKEYQYHLEALLNFLPEIDSVILNNIEHKNIHYKLIDSFVFMDRNYKLYYVKSSLRTEVDSINTEAILMHNYFVYNDEIGCVFRDRFDIIVNNNFIYFSDFKVLKYTSNQKFEINRFLYSMIKNKLRTIEFKQWDSLKINNKVKFREGIKLK